MLHAVRWRRQLPGLLCERLEAVQLECCMAGQGCWVASVEDRGPHELLPRRLEIVQDHNVEAPGLPSPCGDLRSNRMLIEAEITQLDSGRHTLLPFCELAQIG